MNEPDYHLEIQVGKELYKSVLCQDGDGCHIDLAMDGSMADFVKHFNLAKNNIFSVVIDIDCVVFNTKGKEYAETTPILKNIEMINQLFDNGYKVYLIESRNIVGANYRELTNQQLKDCGIKYTKKWDSWYWFKLENFNHPTLSFRRTKNI